MEFRAPLSPLKKTLKDVTAVFRKSELAGDADEPAVWLTVTPKNRLLCSAAHRGLEVRASVGLETGVPGELAVALGQLDRLSVTASDCELKSDGNTITVRAGRFRAEFPAIQNMKRQKFEPIQLTHTFPAKDLGEALAKVEFGPILDGNAAVRIVGDARGLRIWTHNAYHAAHTIVSAEACEPIDFVCQASILMAVCAGQDTVGVGVSKQAWRLKGAVDVTHPAKKVDIEAIEEVLTQDFSANPNFTVDCSDLVEALGSVGSFDQAASTKQAGVTLACLKQKSQIVLVNKTNTSTAKTRLGCSDIQNIEEEHSTVVNFRVLTTFAARLKQQRAIIYILPDRLVLRAGSTTYMMALVQE